MSDKNDDRAGRPARPAVPPFRGAPPPARPPATPSQGAKPTKAPFTPAGQKMPGGRKRVTPPVQNSAVADPTPDAATSPGDTNAPAAEQRITPARDPVADFEIIPAPEAPSESAPTEAASVHFELPATPTPSWEVGRPSDEYDISPPWLLPDPDAVTREFALEDHSTELAAGAPSDAGQFERGGAPWPPTTGAPENPADITYSAHGDDDAAAIETVEPHDSPYADAIPTDRASASAEAAAGSDPFMDDTSTSDPFKDDASATSDPFRDTDASRDDSSVSDAYAFTPTEASRGSGAPTGDDTSPPWNEGAHANVYTDGTFSADAAGSWDQAAVGDSHAGGGGERGTREPNGAADAIEAVARRIRSGELVLPHASAAAMDEAAALAAALSALLGSRR